jgi:hypothetical protein
MASVSALAALGGGFIGSLITALFVPKRQYEYWRKQQYVGLCLDVIQKLRQLTDDYMPVLASGGRPDNQFALRQLSLSKDVTLLFAHSRNTAAWEAYRQFDEVLGLPIPRDSSARPPEGQPLSWPPGYKGTNEEFTERRDKAFRTLLAHIGMLED